jgi:hypothetical protein
MNQALVRELRSSPRRRPVMEDSRRFGVELADATVALMKKEGLVSEEAALLAGQAIVRQADAMTAAGETSEAVTTWTQLVVIAYGGAPRSAHHRDGRVGRLSAE